MERPWSTLLLAVLLVAATALPCAAEEPGPDRLGLSAGVPHTLSLTYERSVVGPLRLQGSVGSIVIFSSACARALVAGSGRLQPYAFAGGGVLYKIPTDTGTSDGWTGYAWWGPGLRLRFGRLYVWTEWSFLTGLNTSNGYDSNANGPAAGVLWAF